MAAPSITATNAGNVTHPQAPLGGPIFIALRVIGYLVPLAALAVVVDSLRRPASHFGGNSARRWMWAGPQLLLLALLGALWAIQLLHLRLSAATLETGGSVVALYLFFAAILQIAYLLVVVFPRRREPIPPEVEKELPRE